MGRPELIIEQVEVTPVRVPRRATFDLQRGASDDASWFSVVRLRTSDGVEGWGECSTRVRSLHWVFRDHLAELLIGLDPFDVVEAHRRMDQAEMLAAETLSQWNPIRAAVDMALYDIQGRWLELPLHQLLGGRQRDRIPVIKNVGVGPPAESAERAAALVADGYDTIKMRVGSDPDLDVARVRAVREAVGSHVAIRVDANQAWDATTAIRTIRRLDAYGLDAVEQPCAYWDVRGSAEVVAHVDVPVIIDESVWTVHDAQSLLSARACDVLHVYLGKCGGVYPTMRIVAVADAFRATITVGERVPLGIAEAAHCHVAAVLPNPHDPHALQYDLNESDLLSTSLERVGNSIVVPDAPGLGIDVDLDKLAFYSRAD